MAAQSIASRSRTPSSGEPDDVVLARALQFSEWARRNIILISVVSVVAVLALAGTFWYRADQARQLDDAAIAFLPVEQAVMSGDEGIAARELQAFIQQYGATPYGDEARLLLAQVHLRGGRTAEAIEVVRPVAAQLDRSPVGAQAALLLAAAQEAEGQREAAIQSYLEVGSRARMEFRRQEGLLGAAALREEIGDEAGAAELYRRLVDASEPGSMDRSILEMRLEEAESKAALP